MTAWLWTVLYTVRTVYSVQCTVHLSWNLKFVLGGCRRERETLRKDDTVAARAFDIYIYNLSMVRTFLEFLSSSLSQTHFLASKCFKILHENFRDMGGAVLGVWRGHTFRDMGGAVSRYGRRCVGGGGGHTFRDMGGVISRYGRRCAGGWRGWYCTYGGRVIYSAFFGTVWHFWYIISFYSDKKETFLFFIVLTVQYIELQLCKKWEL